MHVCKPPLRRRGSGQAIHALGPLAPVNPWAMLVCMLTHRTSPEDHIPRYVRIREEIIRRIEAGDLGVGDQIPSLRNICGEFGVS